MALDGPMVITLGQQTAIYVNFKGTASKNWELNRKRAPWGYRGP